MQDNSVLLTIDECWSLYAQWRLKPDVNAPFEAFTSTTGNRIDAAYSTEINEENGNLRNLEYRAAAAKILKICPGNQLCTLLVIRFYHSFFHDGPVGVQV